MVFIDNYLFRVIFGPIGALWILGLSGHIIHTNKQSDDWDPEPNLLNINVGVDWGTELHNQPAYKPELSTIEEHPDEEGQ